ncbi:Aldose reductase [Yarrowia sp. B02]|nr:Aldose reductase [Yarrowia sp. B02]
MNNGKTIPAIGQGTWKSTTEVAGAVECALTEGGYRHIDTAFNYRNEDAVGLGIKRAMEKGVKREDIFVTSKIWVPYLDRVEEHSHLLPFGNGTVVIPKSVTNSRIVENGKSAVTLAPEDLQELNDLHKTEGIHRTSKPKWGIDLGFPDFDFC